MKDLIALDFETYYAADYSLQLKKYNISEYIRDPQFLIHGIGIQHIGHEPYWVSGHDAALKEVQRLDLHLRPVVAHNMAFDGFILSEHAGVTCGAYRDTLSMARAVVGVHAKLNLDSLAQMFGIGAKTEGLLNTKGKQTLTPEEYKALGSYCMNDTVLCMKLFEIMLPYMPKAEMDLVDLTLRMFCTPRLQIDLPMVLQEHQDEQTRKTHAVQLANSNNQVLGSNPQFAELLCMLGVDPPTKISARTGKETFAFAKTDPGFKELLHHEIEEVRLVAEARLKVKSNLNETRALRLYKAGENGALPVLLNYCAAHTTRWSGGNKLNLQNLPRKGVLRNAIMAPPGYVIIVNDQSQIEARITVWLAKQEDVLQAFRDFDAQVGPDVYKIMAAKIYRIPIERITPEQRFIGKIAVLGMGFGMGWRRLMVSLAIGFMGPPVIIDSIEAKRIVTVYRSANSHVVALWDFLDRILQRMATDKGFNFPFGPLIFKFESVILPNGLSLKYPNMKFDGDKVSYLTRTGRVNIWGGYFLENLVQALARCIIAENMLMISKRNFVATMTHDEIVSLGKTEEADADLQWQQQIMTQPVSWAAGLPLAVEGGYDVRYSK